MQEKDSIHVAFCISDSFAQHTAVVIASALASNPGEHLVFHILSGDLSEVNKALLLKMTSEVCLIYFILVRNRQHSD